MVVLVPEGETFENGTNRRIQNRMGRMSPLSILFLVQENRTQLESYLKPVVVLIELNRKILNLLYRTTEVREIEMDTLSFNSALISAEFNLLEKALQIVFCIGLRVC